MGPVPLRRRKGVWVLCSYLCCAVVVICHVIVLCLTMLENLKIEITAFPAAISLEVEQVVRSFLHYAVRLQIDPPF
jgi:hypothetical protein